MIPRKIHQVWCGPEIPERIQEFCDSTKRLNPDWEHKLHGNEALERYKADPYVRNMVNSGDPMAFIADRIRVLILKEQGGVYVDADAMPLKPLSSLNIWDMPHVDFITGFRDPYRTGVALHRGISLIDNTFMASVPNGRMINRLDRKYSTREPKVNGHGVGVEVLANCREDTMFLNSRYFYAMKPLPPEALFDHDSINLGSWVERPHLQFADHS